MLSYQEALDRLLAAAAPVAESRFLPLAAAHGRILADDLRATLDVPPHDNSAMDGYAVRCADVTAVGTTLSVTQRIPAGCVGTALVAGTAARIFTGAPVPAGADAVVMQEACDASADGTVTIRCVPRHGENIRRAGEDIVNGATIVSAGVRLGPAQLGLAASLGLAQLPVCRRLRVALLSTGDELAEPGEKLRPGAIYNSNRALLRPLLEALGCVVTDGGRIPDQVEATRAAFREMAAGHDLIVSTGGVSVGEEDHVKAAIAAEGQLDLWKIAIKPGKPLAFGKLRKPAADAGKVGAGGTADFIGLPGNPVSCFVTFLMLVRPFILKRMGARSKPLAVRRLVSAADWLRPDQRREFLRARLTADGRVELHPQQGSGVLTSCAWAEGLVDCPPGQAFCAGDLVDFIAFADLYAS